METPPTSPQRQQYRTRQILRGINISQDGSPHRRRLPSVSCDENIPPSARTTSPTPGARPNARSLGQLHRHARERREREEEPPRTRTRKRKRPPRCDPEGPLNARQFAQRARRDRERAEQVAQASDMDVDDPRASPLLSSAVYSPSQRNNTS